MLKNEVNTNYLIKNFKSFLNFVAIKKFQKFKVAQKY